MYMCMHVNLNSKLMKCESASLVSGHLRLHLLLISPDDLLYESIKRYDDVLMNRK